MANIFHCKLICEIISQGHPRPYIGYWIHGGNHRIVKHVFIEEISLEIFTKGVHGSQSEHQVVLSTANLGIVKIQISDVSFVSSPREIHFHIHITHDSSAISCFGKTGVDGNVSDSESNLNHISISLYFCKQVVVKTQRQHSVFIHLSFETKG